ncbi:MAG TPA: homoserine kinase [Dehalococcoidia bacterium]|nr:homoserine kinase [Dehalococcoidia bacterium]
MEPTAVTVRVPATSANVGTGFDCLGLALDLFASITVTFGQDERAEPEDAASRMVLMAARSTYARIGREPPPGMDARYTVSLPLGRGLGASAVARVAGVLAVNEVERRPLDEDACLSVASELEGHGDNACPALFGGVQVCVGAGERLLHVSCKYPSSLAVAVVIPDRSMATKEARRALPDSYLKEDVTHNLGRLAMLVAALASSRLDLLDEATQDRIHQPQRSTLFPPMGSIFEAAKRAGAHAAWLSGAGSSVAALCPEEAGREVAAAMQTALDVAGESGRSLATRISHEGASVSKIELLGS